MSTPKASCHFVGNHVVDFDDADHAHGIVYCHDELEYPDQGESAQGMCNIGTPIAGSMASGTSSGVNSIVFTSSTG